jgi:hypothetical protein
MDAQMRERLQMAGLSAEDIGWLDSFGCADSRVPAPKPSEIEDYRRREAALNASVAALTYAERGESPEGKLAAAIGAHIANAQDNDEDE